MQTVKLNCQANKRRRCSIFNCPNPTSRWFFEEAKARPTTLFSRTRGEFWTRFGGGGVLGVPKRCIKTAGACELCDGDSDDKRIPALCVSHARL